MKVTKISILATILISFNFQSCSPNKKNNVQEITISSQSDGIIGGVDEQVNFAMENGIVGILDISTGGVCTGSLLPNNIVLTAAHCVSEPSLTKIIFSEDLDKIIDLMIENKSPDVVAKLVRNVDFGEVNDKYLKVQSEINELIVSELKGRAIHELSDVEKDQIIEKVRDVKDLGDIALLHFVGSLPEGYKSSKLLHYTELQKHLTEGVETTLAGYGHNDGVQKLGSGVLRSVSGVKVSERFFSQSEVKLDQRFGKGACQGDSGGPAYVTVNGQMKLWGLTSRGYKDPQDHCSQFAVYTNINSWMTWIRMSSEMLIKKSNRAAVLTMILRQQR